MATRVLMVEDEQRLRGIFARYLRARGCDVIETPSVGDAIRLLGSEHVDVIVLDINLPEQTGWDVLRWIAARDVDEARGRPRVIVVSAAPPSPQRIQELKPDAILSKPFPIDALARLVEARAEPEVDADMWEIS